MASQDQLAAFALNAYAPTQANLVAVNGWQSLATEQGGADGFGASVFTGPDGEVVITNSSWMSSPRQACSNSYSRPYNGW